MEKHHDELLELELTASLLVNLANFFSFLDAFFNFFSIFFNFFSAFLCFLSFLSFFSFFGVRSPSSASPRFRLRPGSCLTSAKSPTSTTPEGPSSCSGFTSSFTSCFASTLREDEELETFLPGSCPSVPSTSFLMASNLALRCMAKPKPLLDATQAWATYSSLLVATCSPYSFVTIFACGPIADLPCLSKDLSSSRFKYSLISSSDNCFFARSNLLGFIPNASCISSSS
mmetsp:Transcript_13303/g.34547  ORF Transcript_13303/g.34547 Transcript_13303/m.34547 type:complete len:229 (+) Transcript_13303:116-802(+)